MIVKIVKFFAFYICMHASFSSHLLEAMEKDKKAAQEDVAKQKLAEIDHAVALAVALMDLHKNNMTEEVYNDLEEIVVQIFRMADECPFLSETEKNKYKKGLPKIRSAWYHQKLQERKRALENKKAVGELSLDLFLLGTPQNISYRSLEDESDRLLKLFITKTRNEPIGDVDQEGWTPPMRAVADGDANYLQTQLKNRIEEVHKTVPAGVQKTCTNVCFLMNNPFSKEHRALTQQIGNLAPYTAHYYFHSRDRAPMLVASVVVDKSAFEEFQTQHQLRNNPHVQYMLDASAYAAVEYLNSVRVQSSSLPLTTITSNLGAFYKEHDEYQTEMRNRIKQVITENPFEAFLPVFEYLADQHPLPKLAQKQLKPTQSLAHAKK